MWIDLENVILCLTLDTELLAHEAQWVAVTETKSENQLYVLAFYLPFYKNYI